MIDVLSPNHEKSGIPKAWEAKPMTLQFPITNHVSVTKYSLKYEKKHQLPMHYYQPPIRL
jgi:hypothetical protein